MASDEFHRELLETTRDLARLGGDTARRFLGNVSVSRKLDSTPVTEADHAVQEALLDVIARRHPAHSIIVEETVHGPDRHRSVEEAEYCWVIDPIDGTRNFAAGVSVYSTSVCVMRGGSPIAGAIHDATSGRVFSAGAGVGAFCDDRPIALRPLPAESDCVVFVSSFRRKPAPAAVKGWMDRYLFRNQGSLCIHFAWIACGSGDAAYAPECKLWDLAAGALLVHEAGGVITHADGRALWPMDLSSYEGGDIPVLAGSAMLHAELLKNLTQGRT